MPLTLRTTCLLGAMIFYLVAEWIHFTLFGIILPTIKLKVYTLGGLTLNP